jgi:O-antigen ligase
MWAVIITGIIAIQLLLGLVSPIGLVYFVLAVGALPMTFGDEGSLAGALGKMDLPAFRVLGFWLAASLVLLLRPAKLPRYISAYRFHLLFLAFCAAAMFWAPSLSYAMRMFAKLSAPLLFLLLLTTTVTSRRQLKTMEALIVISALGLLVVAVAYRLAGIKLNPVGITVPGVGPSLFSALLVVVAVLALAGAKYHRRLSNAALAAICSVGVLAAFTRITIAALFVGCSTVLFVGFRGVMRLLLPVAAMVGFPLLFLFNETFKKRMFYGDSKITPDAVLADPSIVLSHLHTSGRSVAWSSVLGQFFAPNPTLGSGLGATQNYYYSQAGSMSVIHSEYVRLLSEVGIVGMVLFSAAALAYLWRLGRIYRRARDKETERYALAAIGALVAYLVYIATDNGFDYVSGFGIYVFALIGMAEKSRELAQSPRVPASIPVPELAEVSSA